MKLYARTLLIIIGLILFQSFLTFILVTNSIKTVNENDYTKELRDETAAALDTFYETKQLLWEGLLKMSSAGTLLEETVISSENADSTYSTAVKGLLNQNRVDWVVFQNIPERHNSGASASAENHLLFSLNLTLFPFDEFSILPGVKEFPSLGLYEHNGALYLIGSVQLENAVHVYLIKSLNMDFLRSLPQKQETLVTLMLDGEPFLINQTQAAERSDFNSFPEMVRKPVIESYRLFQDGGSSYYMNLIKLGSVESSVIGSSGEGGTEDENASLGLQGQKTAEMEESAAESKSESKEVEIRQLCIGVGISNQAYDNRLMLIRSNLFWVSGAVSLLAAALALLFSRHLTKPIRKLVLAMNNIRKGNYHSALPQNTAVEVKTLVSGFRAMETALEKDKIAMNTYIDEITHLKDFNEQVIDSLQSAIVIVSPEGTITHGNSNFFSLSSLGSEAAGGRAAEAAPELFTPDLLEEMKLIVRGEKESSVTNKRLGRDMVYEIKIYPFSMFHADDELKELLIVIDDISKRLEADEKIYQAEKLASISLLTAGVAHEINNPLTSILSNVQLLIEDETDADKEESLKWMEQETKRIARIISKLLNFSGQGMENDFCPDAVDVLENVIHLFSYSVDSGKHVHIVKSLESMPTLGISSDELRQISMNLLKNALQAISYDGSIEISCRYIEDKQQGEIVFSDSGPGIDEKYINKIFDPFFTTKLSGEGLGLGLSLVYGIIKKRGGLVDVENNEDSGVSIRIILPVLIDT
ncbi:MAG: HAMP domain-containing protein [Spirochaetales bacterium]|nr:HAMP domain-containing protein [Spirochaetales bacterium]